MNIEDAKLRKVDTRSGKAPHARHLAIVNRILVCGYKEKPGERGDILNGEVAATRCGKMLRNFYTADDISLTNTEGGVYSVECPRCFPEASDGEGGMKFCVTCQVTVAHDEAGRCLGPNHPKPAGGRVTVLCAGCRAPVAVTSDVAESGEPVACAVCDRLAKCPTCHKPMNEQEAARGACYDCERLQRDESTLPGERNDDE